MTTLCCFLCNFVANNFFKITQVHTREEKMKAFGRLLDIMDDLREKCPWDRKQTYESLRPNTVEETFELCDALIRNDEKNICKELGDVLLHVIFYAKIGSEGGNFDIADVCNQLCDKLIFRHPHVYGDAVAETAGDVRRTWEQIKQKEKDGNKTVLSGVPDALPALIKAYRIQDKARNVGFDWEQREDVWEKVHEELGELRAELAKDDRQRSTEEFGDFLFSLINAARLYHINPDNALELTNQKFIRRFNYVEAKAKEQGKALKDMTLAEMDELWEEAKKDPTPGPSPAGEGSKDS
ncbi:MAG: nucleoside triphosphate pyrophosphohydrolase [Bacteroidaceae bacterium]|nr:nucleoside triphosphate pyrophosphohydrolase [Bacteroidaceae bacterium]